MSGFLPECYETKCIAYIIVIIILWLSIQRGEREEKHIQCYYCGAQTDIDDACFKTRRKFGDLF